MTNEPNEVAKRPRGFAAMDPERQRAIARKGGLAVKPEQRSFSKSPELAAAAGRKGGSSVPPESRSYFKNRDLAVSAGRKGGHASHGTVQPKKTETPDA